MRLRNFVIDRIERTNSRRRMSLPTTMVKRDDPMDVGNINKIYLEDDTDKDRRRSRGGEEGTR